MSQRYSLGFIKGIEFVLTLGIASAISVPHVRNHQGFNKTACDFVKSECSHRERYISLETLSYLLA